MEPSSIVFPVGGKIDHADIQPLCDALAELLAAADAGVVICDVGAIARADAVVVDALAHLRLIACRRGSKLRLRHVSTELCELVAFMGLCEPLSSEPRCSVTS